MSKMAQTYPGTDDFYVKGAAQLLLMQTLFPNHFQSITHDISLSANWQHGIYSQTKALFGL